MTGPPPTEIAVADNYPPGLGSGSYRLQLSQAVDVAGAQETYSQEYGLKVYGPRFTLDPADIYTQFPPPNAVGAYADYLPQVVFTRATLPWERTVDGKPQPTVLVPFLALLLLGEDDHPPDPVQRTVRDLVEPEHTNILGPTITTADVLDQGGKLTDPCTTVDLPPATFTGVVPTYDVTSPTTWTAFDLPFLAHIRQVDQTQKPLPTPTPDGWFSVVVGNRFPKAGAANRVYLVSLEGFPQVLPPATIPTGKDTVRLAVFATWSFIDNGESAEFETLAANLNAAGLALPTAAVPPTTPSDKDLALGYAPLVHTTRQAEHLVSWYRGPLAPLSLPQETGAPWPSSDAVLRFNPDIGMLDTSYAAAWQLGRLLALADTHFSSALYEWRRRHQRSALLLAQRIALARRFPSLRLPNDPGALLATHPVRDRIMRFVREDMAPALLGRNHRRPPDLFGPLAEPERGHRHRPVDERDS